MSKRSRTARPTLKPEQEAEELLEEAPAENPWRLRALLGLLVVLAIAAVVTWIQRGPMAAVPPVPTIELQALDPEVASAITLARESVMQSPRSAQAWGELGMILHAHVLRDPAATCYEAAGALDPKDPLWPYLQGLILKGGNTPAAAIACLRRAAALTQPNSLPRLYLADLLVDQAQYSEAEAELKIVLKADPKDVHARLCRAQLDAAQEKYDAAIENLETVTDSSYARAKATALLATIHERQGNDDAARRARRRLAGLPPDMPWPDVILDGVARRQVGLRARLSEAQSLIVAGRVDAAVDKLHDTVRKYATADEAWSLLGRTLILKRDGEGAERAMLKAIELTPKSREHRFYLGLILQSLNRERDAADCFQRAIELRPADAESYLRLGECREKLDDKPGAADAYEQALRHQPNLEAARQALERLRSSPKVN